MQSGNDELVKGVGNDEKKPRLRILHVVSSLMMGGMEMVVLSLAEIQVKDGHDVKILAIKGGVLHEAASKKNIGTIILGGSNKFRNVFSSIKGFTHFKPDIIHVHNPTSLQYAAIGKMITGARILVTDHGQTRGIKRIPSTFELRLMDCVVAVSQETASKTKRWGWEKSVTVIHNGVSLVPSTRDKDVIRAELKLDNTITGIMVSGFHKVKGHIYLIDALDQLRSMDISVKMLIVGGGAEKENIELMAEKLKLGPDRVQFLGIRSDVADLLKAADFFVLPSLMEGLPLAILEAMTVGLPIIATPVGGVPELVEDGVSGLLIPAQDVTALTDAMATVIREPELRARLGETGRKRVESGFTFQEMSRKYEKLYYGIRA